MKKWEIWMSGYAMNESFEKARLIGEEMAETFREACQLHFHKRPSETYDPQTNRDWGCALHDNEADARKGFG